MGEYRTKEGNSGAGKKEGYTAGGNVRAGKKSERTGAENFREEKRGIFTGKGRFERRKRGTAGREKSFCRRTGNNTNQKRDAEEEKSRIYTSFTVWYRNYPGSCKGNYCNL